jgi:hypothetical protein
MTESLCIGPHSESANGDDAGGTLRQGWPVAMAGAVMCKAGRRPDEAYPPSDLDLRARSSAWSGLST